MSTTAQAGASESRAWRFGSGLRSLVVDIGQGYAWVALLPHAAAGVLLAAITLLENPRMAGFGLAGALAAWFGARCVAADADQRPIAVFNGLLLGLLLGATGLALAQHCVLLLLACAFTGGATVVAGSALAQRTGLGVYSAPFALMAIALHGMGAVPAQGLAAVASTPAPEASAALLALAAQSIAGLFFLHSQWAGWAILLAIGLASRYYLLLLLGAIAVSAVVAAGMPVAQGNLLISANANAVLTMLLVGGLLSMPSVASALCAALAAALAAALTWMAGMLWPTPVYSLPFVLASWTALWSMRRHPELQDLLHPRATLPEEALTRKAMAANHPAYSRTPTLAVPFNGIWTVSQDSDGPHTHVGVLRHALDFVRIVDGRSFSGVGAIPGDFHAFDQPVFAPASGEVVLAVSHVADNPIGEIDAANRWGNHVVIRMENGLYALLAHLRAGSLLVGAGAHVRQGQAVGSCGNSGRSPQPHLHLHVQTTAYPGSPTVPFVLSNLWLDAGLPVAHHAQQALPVTGQQIGGAALPSVFPLALLPGRGLRYRARQGTTYAANWTLECALTPDGRWKLVSSAGGSCIAAQRNGMFFCSERDPIRDEFLDAWLLACANTATSSDVTHWSQRSHRARDSVNRCHRALSWLGIPPLTVLRSHGTRTWQEQSQCWQQSAVHQQALSGKVVQTQACLSPLLGAVEVRAEGGDMPCELTAVALFQRSDVGIPGWERPFGTAD